MCVSTRERIQFPSVLLHPTSLASVFSASDGDMSRRSGVPAEADNHSDISPFDSLRSLTAGRRRNCVRARNLLRSLTDADSAREAGAVLQMERSGQTPVQEWV